MPVVWSASVLFQYSVGTKVYVATYIYIALLDVSIKLIYLPILFIHAILRCPLSKVRGL